MVNKKSRSLEYFLLLALGILRNLKSKGIVNSYGLIGGLAVGSIGVPRATKNVDFIVSTDNIRTFYEEIENLFNKKNIFVELKNPEYGIFPYYAVICYEKRKDEKLRIIDILIATERWQDEISNDTIVINLARKQIPIVKIEGLIVLKLKSGGGQDLLDVQNILKLTGIEKLDHEKLRDWAKRAGIEKLLNRMLSQCMSEN
jgi:hypothetical protein